MTKVNENREGYKETKLGWIPDEWRICPLENLGDIYTGGTPDTKEDDYWNGNIIWYTPTEISKSGKYVNDSRRKISIKGLSKSSAKIFPKNTIVVCTRATIGELAISLNEAATNQGFKSIKPNSINDEEYLYYILSNQKQQLIRKSLGSTFLELSTKDFRNFTIACPPLKEQKKIAEILSSWDNAIEHTQTLVDKLKVRKKGLMQQLLSGKTRLPGFSEEWKEVKLEDITSRITTKNLELNDNVVTISAQRGFVRQEDFFKKRVASNTLSGYYLINKGDFAYNKSYSNGYPMGAFKRLNKADKAVVTTLYLCFSIKNNIDSDFMVNFFEGGLMTNNLMRIAQEGGRAHGLLNISLRDFFSLKLTIPPLNEQQQIAKVLTEADNQINQQQAYLEQLKEQKKGLMQQLLTGQKRVTLN